MTAAERYSHLFPIAQDIALELTKITKREWVAQAKNPLEFWNYIKITSGTAELSITETAGRIVVHGNTPQGKDNQYIRVYVQSFKEGKPYRWDEFKFSSISVATSRGALAIAKNIAGRFLPDYLKAVDLTLAKIQADQEYADNRRANLEACAATLGETLRSDYRPIHGCDPVLEPVTHFTKYLGKDSSGIRVEVHAGNRDVDVKIDNLTVAQAQRFPLKIVEGFEQEKSQFISKGAAR